MRDIKGIHNDYQIVPGELKWERERGCNIYQRKYATLSQNSPTISFSTLSLFLANFFTLCFPSHFLSSLSADIFNIIFTIILSFWIFLSLSSAQVLFRSQFYHHLMSSFFDKFLTPKNYKPEKNSEKHIHIKSCS